MRERNNGEMSPLDFLREHREKGRINKRKIFPESGEERFLNMSGLNMILEDLPVSVKKALLVTFTKIASNFFDTGRVPIVMPIDESGLSMGSVKINQN